LGSQRLVNYFTPNSAISPESLPSGDTFISPQRPRRSGITGIGTKPNAKRFLTDSKLGFRPRSGRVLRRGQTQGNTRHPKSVCDFTGPAPLRSNRMLFKNLFAAH
jgi:hypothetical protein